MYTSLLLFLAAASTSVLADDPGTDAGCTYIDPPENSNGWCYYCSDDDAPPLCNSQCLTAIDRLCLKGDLTTPLIDTEQDCTIKYMPPTYGTNRNGARQPGDSRRQCRQHFTQILLGCGKDASTPLSATVNQTYCTASGGGGTYGWNDAGTVMEHVGRYVVQARDTDQCGQHKAMWQEADKVIQCTGPLFRPDDQVKLITDAPAPTGSIAAMASNIPQENPECKTEVCNLKQEPYYAHIPRPPWPEGGEDMMRHEMVYEGWSDDAGSTAFQYSLKQRCGEDPHNWQTWVNGSQHIVDFDLSNNTPEHCECAAWAAFDASGGIELPLNAFCEPSVAAEPEFNPISHDELRKRSYGPSVFKRLSDGGRPMLVPRAYR